MLTVFKDNPVLAELDIFVTQPDQQWLLLDNLIAYTHDILKQQPGYIANAIHRSLMGCASSIACSGRIKLVMKPYQ